MDHLKKLAKKIAAEIGATRGKPFVRLVPAPEEPHSLYGCLAGLAKAEGDLAEPVDVTWDGARH